jgi:hypothetical protein
VRFKATNADVEQDAGIVWRWIDADTYYVVEASARQDICSVYRVKKGKRKLLAYKAVIIAPYLWHEVSVAFSVDDFIVSIDGELVVGGKDSSYPGPGHVGLWTKADSSIRFDDFRVLKSTA